MIRSYLDFGSFFLNEALVLLGGIDKFISPGDRVLLKPNMLEGVDKGTGVATHPEIVIDVSFSNRSPHDIGAVFGH